MPWERLVSLPAPLVEAKIAVRLHLNQDPMQSAHCKARRAGSSTKELCRRSEHSTERKDSLGQTRKMPKARARAYGFSNHLCNRPRHRSRTARSPLERSELRLG